MKIYNIVSHYKILPQEIREIILSSIDGFEAEKKLKKINYLILDMDANGSFEKIMKL